MNQIWSTNLSFNYPSISLATHSKPNIQNLVIFTFFSPHFLAIENLQNHFIYEFWISLFGKIYRLGPGQKNIWSNFVKYPKWWSSIGRFSQFFTKYEYERQKILNILLYFWLPTWWIVFRNLMIFLKFWSNSGHWNSQKTHGETTVCFQFCVLNIYHPHRCYLKGRASLFRVFFRGYLNLSARKI
jgi:hypothetical protein